MAERGKVIAALEERLKACGTNRGWCTIGAETLEAAIKLLKETPIRCADCEYYEKRCPSEEIGWCNRPGAGCGQPEDFWCAGGTKKKGEQNAED